MGEIIFLNKNLILSFNSFLPNFYIFVLIEKLYENCNFYFFSLSLSLLKQNLQFKLFWKEFKFYEIS